MFTINEDKSIYLTRGDAVQMSVRADNNGLPYEFQPDDVVRFRVFEKKGCNCVVLQKDFKVTEAAESVDIVFTKVETKFGDIINKPKDYWYEVELNPHTSPQTIVGYDDDGPKVLRLFPEGADNEPVIANDGYGNAAVVYDGISNDGYGNAAMSYLGISDDGNGNVVIGVAADGGAGINELKTLTLNGVVYNSFADNTTDDIINNTVLPRLLPTIAEEDNGKVLTAVDGKASWKTPKNNGNGLTAKRIEAIKGLFAIAAYTEDAKAAYQAFVDAFDEPECQHEYDNDCDDTCNLCGETRSVVGHTYKDMVTKEPNCGSDGVRTYTCTKCGDSYTEAIPALESHTYTSEVTKAPNCGSGGYRTYTCDKCGHSYKEAIQATGEHTYDSDCDDTCNTCGATRTAPHAYNNGEVTKPATWGEDGVMTYTCTLCGDTYTKVIPALAPPVLTATYSPKTPNDLRVNFDYDTDDADAIRDWLAVTDDTTGEAITDYTLSKNDDGDVVVSYNGATATVDIVPNKMVIDSAEIKRGSTDLKYSAQDAGAPYTGGKSNNTKMIYPHFITAKAGYSYAFAISLTSEYYANDADRANPKIVVEWYNGETMDLVANHATLSGYGDESTSWQTFPDGLVFTYTPQATIGGSPLSAFRFVLQSPDYVLRADMIEKVTITATPSVS